MFLKTLPWQFINEEIKLLKNKQINESISKTNLCCQFERSREQNIFDYQGISTPLDSYRDNVTTYKEVALLRQPRLLREIKIPS